MTELLFSITLVVIFKPIKHVSSTVLYTLIQWIDFTFFASFHRRLAINPCTMMLGILYCERLRQINPEYLKKISSADLFVVSLVSTFQNPDTLFLMETFKSLMETCSQLLSLIFSKK